MLSIGVHYNKGNWKTCLMENGHTLELRLFKEVCVALEYVHFLYVDAGYDARSIVVVEDGRIVNGIGETSATYCSQATSLERNEPANWSDHLEQEAPVKLAFWEGLTQDLVGLMAIHHLEDIVVTGQLKEAVVKKWEDRYQFYLFPYNEREQVGFEAAIGAAIIAEGLYRPGLAAEVVERLQIKYAAWSE